MTLGKTSAWTTAAMLAKLSTCLLIAKLLSVEFGPAGIGQAGNFRQLLTVLGVLSGAGIFNGVTKYVAQYHGNAYLLRAVLGTSASMVIGFSVLLGGFFLLAVSPISQGLFGHSYYKGLVRLVALVQIGIAWSNLMLALMKGFRDASGSALTLIFGSVIGAIAYYFCHRLGSYEGALVGVALVPTLIVIPAVLMVVRKGNIPLRYLRPQWNIRIVIQLGKFSLMALMTSSSVLATYMIVRNLLVVHYDWGEVGIWQGINTISDAYLQFITGLLNGWLLPTLSSLNDKQDLSREIFSSLRFVLLAATITSLCVWLLRDTAIWLLFSEKFIPMRGLFAWQMVGNILRIGAYVFGYLVVAKASLCLYILAELSQFLLLISFSHWLIPAHGALGGVQAYMATYMIYFSACYSAFLYWRNCK